MKLKSQILMSVLGITLFAQTIFGFMAYRQITESRGDQLTIFLQYLNREVADHLTVPSNSLISKIYLEELRRKFSTKKSVLLVQSHNEILYSAGDSPSDMNSLLKQLQSVSDDLSKHGLIELGDKEYYWAISQLPDPEYQLIMLEPAGDEEAKIVSILRVRLISSGVVILWIAVWISLLLASKISQKLDEKNDQLKYQALHDNLTGLPNRALLEDRLKQVLLQSERNDQLFAFFLMDLDRFKEVNDTLGHHFGDELLKSVSNRLMEAIREKDTIARLGGDEFAVLMPDTDLPGAELCAKRILRALGTPYLINDVSIESRVSIGIALYPDHGETSQSIVQFADVAMYQAKKSRTGYAIYNASQNEHTARRLQLMNDIREAIQNNVISAFYQPLVNCTEHKVVAVEILSRWVHPQLGDISPDEFIPMVEQIGLSRVLSMQILRQALEARESWVAAGYEFNMALNLSMQCLQDIQLPSEINSVLQMYNTQPENLELEVTESIFMHDLNRSRKILNGLRKMGMKLSIDDFGTGFSSLSYLKNLPIDTIKIDKSFVDDVEESSASCAIVKSIIELAHNLDCKVVVEGIENKEMLDIIIDMGADFFQGFYFSPAMSAKDCLYWLKAYSTRKLDVV